MHINSPTFKETMIFSEKIKKGGQFYVNKMSTTNHELKVAEESELTNNISNRLTEIDGSRDEYFIYVFVNYNYKLPPLN